MPIRCLFVCLFKWPFAWFLLFVCLLFYVVCLCLLFMICCAVVCLLLFVGFW